MEIYVDGSCRGNPGPGGWGVWIPKRNIKLQGTEDSTTNNRMELTAAINGLRYVKESDIHSAVIVSDSNYVVKGATEWMIRWKTNSWKNSTNKTVENLDLWLQLDSLNVGISWKKVKGHSGDINNDIADALANGK
jgi:ribonuclease HI